MSPAWWQPWFPKPESWAAWFAFWKASFALPMSEADLAFFRECTGRDRPPAEPPKEIAESVGRRGGKSRAAATTAAWLAVFVDWKPYLSRGERAMVLVLAADRKQARVVFRYIKSLIADHPELRKLIAGETQETLELRNGVTIEVSTASFRTVRGYSIAAVIADEIAFWLDSETSANPAEEILAAVRPAMATMGPNALLLMMSSPHARKGPLWQAFQRYYGKQDAPVLVWKAPTKTMNPSVSQRLIDEAYEQDPARAAAEYGAEFRADVETYITREVVDAAVVARRFELPPVSGTRYVGFCDPSGGSSDSMTIAIAHREKDGRAILDAIRERRPPFSPDSVVSDFATLLLAYGIADVISDRYAGEWPRERFRAHGIRQTVAEKPKSDIYRDFLPLMNSGRVELLDSPRLTSQLCSLERRTTRGGRDSIDHPPGGAHDDLANAVAGAIVHLGQVRQPLVISDEVLLKSAQLAPRRAHVAHYRHRNRGIPVF